MKHGDERKQPPRGIEVDGDLMLEALYQELGALVVQSPPSHVDRLDLAWCRRADRLIIALANQEIVLHEATKRRERQMMGNDRPVVLGADIEDEPGAHQFKREAIGSALVPHGRERVFLHQVLTCNGALWLQIP